MRIDARILNVATKRAIAGEPIALNAPYPDGYFDAQSRLTAAVLKALRIQTTPQGLKQLQLVARNTKSAEAQELYNKAISRARSGEAADLQAAIALLTGALTKDPDFGLAYAAKSEMELRLGQTGSGTMDLDRLKEQALDDARKAVQKSPSLGRSHEVLANAYNAMREYERAAAAARAAVNLTPNDVNALLALARAKGRGDLIAGDDLDRAFRLQPGVSYILRECPKITVVNNTDGVLDVSFSALKTKEAFKTKEELRLKVEKGATRSVAILPGEFFVSAKCTRADLFEQRRFEASNEYKLTYTGSGCGPPAYPAIVVRNTGTEPINVQISGKNNPVLVKSTIPGKTERRIMVVPGDYSVLVTAKGLADSADTVTLGPKDEEILDYAVVVQFIR